jgi:triosephosphate isomerase (TIM)
MVESSRKQYFVGGNWKCNGTQSFLKDMIENTLNKVVYDPSKVQVAIAPSTLHIPHALTLLSNHILVAA